MSTDTQIELQAPFQRVEASPASPERVRFTPDLLSCLNLPSSETERIFERLKPAWENLRAVDGGVMLAHSERTAWIVAGIASRYRNEAGIPADERLSQREIGQFTLSALLHDIGKGAKENGEYKYQKLLTNGRALMDAERAEMAQHAQDGYKILIDAGLPEEIARVSLDHHSKAPPNLATVLTSTADHMDAATDPGRTYIEPLTRFQAYEDILKAEIEPLSSSFPFLALAYDRFCREEWLQNT